ncbi:hypothetical protein WR25_22487 [Diploscapter pachys]|uniref:LRAT domain-containing protein n=1 Tax=Diploscapter pachys TaxID=2018661 RepID=A0A2A2JHB6_9BILA|nr:hypothetical protein WR25_22487 [Diploscapter pachys]
MKTPDCYPIPENYAAGDFKEPDRVIFEARKGDLLEYLRDENERHWSVFVGCPIKKCYVVHYSRDKDDKSADPVKKEEFYAVAGKSKMRVNNETDIKHKPLEPNDIIERAENSIERTGSHVFWDSSDYFAKWCRYGYLDI